MTDSIGVLQAILGERYQVERELGRGGMATIYLARDAKHDRDVAVKVLRPEIGALLGAERFLHEIKLTSRLQHPHILPLYDSGQQDAVLFYVMPYVAGESLRHRLQREHRLPVAEAVRIAREVAGALACAHEHNIVHRDIKPENILLSGAHALVADFGIARAISRAGGEKWETLTASGVAVGTPAYMSPEQSVGLQDLDARSDIYSLGCVLYEMLCGAPPFVGPDGELQVARRFTEPAPRVHDSRDGVPAALDAVVARALERDPAARHASAAELADLLAPTFSTVERPGRRLRLATSRRWATLGIGAMVAAGVLIALVLARRAPFEPSRDGEAPALASGGTGNVQPGGTGNVQPRSAPASPPPAREPRGVTGQTGNAAATPPAAPVEAGIQRPGNPIARGRTAAGERSTAAAAPPTSPPAGRDPGGTTRSDSRAAVTGTSAAPQQPTAAASITSSLAPPAPTVPIPASSTAASAMPPAPAPAPADPRPGIERAVAEYARAIESRDIAALRQIYPGLTEAQRQGWSQFFQDIRTMRASLAVEQLAVTGSTAEATVRGTYEYTTRSGSTERRPVSFRMTLRADGERWRVVAVK